MTDWYVVSGAPATSSSGTSSTMRGEFNSIAAAFAKLAGYTGLANQIVVVNAGATGHTTVTSVPVANGGTGAASFTSNGIMLGGGAGALTVTAKPALGEVLVGQAGAPVLQSGSTLLTTLGVNNTHTGDVTGGAALTIGANKVVLSMLEQRATATFMGRNTAGTGNVEELSVATVKTMLALTGTNSGDQTITLTGDVTGSGVGSFATTIANNAVTTAKILDANVTLAKVVSIATASILGRNTAGTGVPEVLTGAQALAIVGGAAAAQQVIAGAGLTGGGTLAADRTLDVVATSGGGLIVNANDMQVSRVHTGTTNEVGYLGVPQNAQAANYTLVAADSGKHIFHASGDGAGDTYTIPANASVAYAIGTVLTFINADATNTVAIAITTDTMTLAGTATPGTRTLSVMGIATAVKMTATTWIISGNVT